MTVVPFGHWPSPLAPADVAAGKVSLSELCSDGDSLFWVETRPGDGGRSVFVRSQGPEASVEDLSTPDVSVRSRVHEYGGGAACLVPQRGSGACAYVEAAGQRVWFIGDASPAPLALSAEPPEGMRWAHGGLTASADGAWVLAVREELVEGDHSAVPRRSVVALSTDGREGETVESTLLSGHDFYGTPVMRADGGSVAAATWDHPDMQWDFSCLEVVELSVASGVLTPVGPPWSPTDGDDGAVASVGQPMWCHDGHLCFIWDRFGWWQPFRHSGDRSGAEPERLSEMEAEFHGADFILSLRTMAEMPDGSIVAKVSSSGRDGLVRLQRGGEGQVGGWSIVESVDQPCISISAVCAHGEGLALIGATATEPSSVWVIDALGERARNARPPREILRTEDASLGESITVTGRSGQAVHVLLFPPQLAGTEGPTEVLPPLIVQVHGGPTSSCSAAFDVTTQYFTSRGFACALVDYAGSTGYGRDFRCGLWGRWGVADAEDCEDAARALAAAGRVDGDRMAIRGGSSGGLTALNALAAGNGFKAAVSWYGVTDLIGLVETTHDFEAHYTDRLIGVLPQDRPEFDSRSPVNKVAELNGSVLMLQGLDDAVVPPSQTEHLRDAMVAAGRHCEAIFFPDEGHGFRRPETLVRCLEAELDFYQRELSL